MTGAVLETEFDTLLAVKPSSPFISGSSFVLRLI